MRLQFGRLFVCFLLLSGCTPQNFSIGSFDPPFPMSMEDSSEPQILILNSFNVSEKKYREGKEELFTDLLENLMVEMESEIFFRARLKSKILKGFTPLGNTDAGQDSVVTSLLKEHNLLHGIVISEMNVSFMQTGVEVTDTDSGKEREASYNIEAVIDYSFMIKISFPGKSGLKKRLFIQRGLLQADY